MSEASDPAPPPAAPGTAGTPAFARGVIAAVGAVVAVLTIASGWYGYHRDELYFMMLPPAWGYVDQPPLVPLLAGALGSSPWLLRIPATVGAAASVLLVSLIARELGAGRRAQVWTAWAYAGTVAVLDFGHVFLTTALDLALWSAICWLVVRAELRSRPQLWLVAGLVAGLASYVKLLVAVLLIGIALGLAITARRRLLSRHVLGGAVVAAVVALPNLAYQVLNGFPQLAMGAALAAKNAGEVRWFAWVFLVIALGPVLLPTWLAGLRALWVRDDWRPVRFLVPAFVLLVAFTVVSGAQPHYPVVMLGVALAAGMAARTEPAFGPGWRAWVAVNAAVAAVVSLPLLPLRLLSTTPIPEINQLIADQVGWPAYAAQIEAVYRQLPSTGDAVVVTSNYGEAGAVARFTDLPVHSGHNALGELGPPPTTTRTVVWVGGQLPVAEPLFEQCDTVDLLDNGVGVDNEEQGMPIAVCTDPVVSWPLLWERVRHLD